MTDDFKQFANENATQWLDKLRTMYDLAWCVECQGPVIENDTESVCLFCGRHISLDDVTGDWWEDEQIDALNRSDELNAYEGVGFGPMEPTAHVELCTGLGKAR